MCGRYTLSSSAEEIADAFGDDLNVDPAFSWEPRFNLAPSQLGVVVRPTDDDRRELALMRWGLIPFWSKDRKIGSKLINARAETVAEKPAFRAAYRKRRCLVAADGYYEWAKTKGGKQPYYIHPVRARVFGFAGLWEKWTDENDEDVFTYTVLTTDASAEVRWIHNRMPVIVDPKHYATWLDHSSKPEDLRALLGPSPDGTFGFDPVSTYVNSPRNEGPDCTRTLDPPPANGARARS